VRRWWVTEREIVDLMIKLAAEQKLAMLSIKVESYTDTTVAYTIEKQGEV
jgi:hypothetical protein